MRSLRVFLCSPGDVAEERELARRIIERFQLRYKDRLELILTAWEDLPMSATRTFQDQIPRSADYDVVVAILWNRLGSPLPDHYQRPDGRAYESGTVYELELALGGRPDGHRPSVLLYYKTADAVIVLSQEQGSEGVQEQLRQREMVREFLASRFGPGTSDKPAYTTIASASAFEERFAKHLNSLIEKHLGREPGSATRALTHSDSPFRGLLRFDYNHRLYYFGRTRQINQALEQLRRQAGEGRPFLMIFGRSGVGKSSFLRAGVAPMLTSPDVIEGVRHWRWCVFEPSDSTGSLLEGLAAALIVPGALPELGQALGGEQKLAEALVAAPAIVADQIARCLWAVAGSQPQRKRSQPPARLALLIDPLEEIFTRKGASKEDCEQFFKSLDTLVRAGLVWTLGTMRADFYERCGEIPELVALKSGSGQFHLAAPTHGEIDQMIRYPAQLAGLEYEESDEQGSLASTLLGTADREGGLPMLQFALEELFRRSNAAQTGLLTFVAYEQMGGVEGALKTKAGEAERELKLRLGEREGAVALDQVFDWIIGLDKAGGRPVRNYSRLEDVPKGPTTVAVQTLIEERLLMTDIDDEQRPVFTLAHEALLVHWPLLEHWIRENKGILEIKKRVEVAALEWGRDRDRSRLLRGKALAEALDLLQHNAEKLDEPARVFVRASDDAARGDERKHRHRIQAAAGIFAVLALAAGVAAGIGFRQRNRAREAEVATTVTALAAQDLIKYMLKDLRKALLPSDERDARMISGIAHQVRAFYETLDLSATPPQTRPGHRDTLLEMGQILDKMGRRDDNLVIAHRLDQALREWGMGESIEGLQALNLLARCEDQVGNLPAAAEARARGEALIGRLPDTSGTALIRANFLRESGEGRRRIGHFREAAARHQRANELLRVEPASEARNNELAVLLTDWGEALRNAGQLEESERRFREAKSLASDKDFHDNGRLAEIMANLGVLLHDRRKLDESRTELEAALKMRVAAIGDDKPDVAADRYRLARVLTALEDYDGAKKQLELSEAVIGKSRNALRRAKLIEARTELLLAQQKFPEALNAAEEVLAIRLSQLENQQPHPEIIKAMRLRATVLLALGRTADADTANRAADEQHKDWLRREEASETPPAKVAP